MNKMKSKRRMEQVLCYVVLILLALMVLVPVLWMISTAFKTEAQTYSPKPQWIQSAWSPSANSSLPTISEE